MKFIWLVQRSLDVEKAKLEALNAKCDAKLAALLDAKEERARSVIRVKRLEARIDSYVERKKARSG